ncbi:hypothetical protein DFQ04_0545 [Algoriphagus boseongensis]|uniref:Uncharacterized protein n=1 Tax=Algoriphagus boseongensis TaxID=1442587 RepID=A0A4R6T927_9BACT|nr:hypothetical protein [Algoriphagus boseongensis]TDQ18739.1 hypothetical protein DFQ04_0545 [Algoriphagus boseongensis]
MKEELKLVLFRFWPLFFLIFGVPALSYGIWILFPEKSLEVIVIDKTVPKTNFREHTGIFWALNHEKFIKSDGDQYDQSLDYFGFFPSGDQDLGTVSDLSKKSEGEIQDLVEKADVVFLADTYGVYKSDFEEKIEFKPEEKIYGGLDQGDIDLAKKASQEGKTLIAEFNSMASPTSESIRSELENLMGIKWTGWIGRYFDEMDTLVDQDIPRWLIQQYKDQKGAWSFSGAGLVFVKNTGEIEVFSFGKDYQNQVPFIRTQKVNKHGFSLPQVVPYPDWFDVVMIERDYQVISYYDIDPTNEGLQRLRSMGLPRFFPAAVFREINGGMQYYFAGDFSDMENRLGSPSFAGLPLLWRGLYVVADHRNRQSFYWNYYLPLITQVFEKVYESKSN